VGQSGYAAFRAAPSPKDVRAKDTDVA
jgi:hypothetical protein